MSILTKDQKKHYRAEWTDDEGAHVLIAQVRYDDQCVNGHNTFSITGTTYGSDRDPYEDTIKNAAGKTLLCNGGGCVHELIAERIPELAPYIKWHLVSSDEPMHYGANCVYHAGDRDHWGLRKGEFRQHTSRGKYQNGGVEGVPCWELVMPDVKEVYAAEKPAPVTLEWVASGMTGGGKERELDYARSSAVWPDATDEELTQEPEALKAALKARLPQLMKEFREAVESLGFTY